jgi:hypothetical protein
MRQKLERLARLMPPILRPPTTVVRDWRDNLRRRRPVLLPIEGGATVSQLYGTAGQSISISLASLAHDAARSSASIDNTSDLFLDALVQLQVVLQTGTPGSDGVIFVYAYGTADSDTVAMWGHTDIDGTDKAMTLINFDNLRRIGTIACPTSGGTFESSPMSVAAAFGGILPRRWGILCHNRTNIALSATEGNHLKKFQGCKGQSA